MKKLANSQEAIYAYICAYYQSCGYPPTVREICDAVGLSSPATVHAHLKAMEAKGLIRKDPKKQRTFTIPNLQHRQSVEIPLLGNVAAGIPILAEENVEDAFPLPRLLTNGSGKDDAFMLHVCGDSMMNAGIFDQDIIVVSIGQHVEEGDIIVARVDGGEVTVKRLHFDGKLVCLQPENPAYQPICLPAEQVEIVGKVTGLMRRV